MFRRLARQPHNDVCRERLRGILKEGAKVKNAEGRRKDFEDKELEKKRKKEEKKEGRREEKENRREEKRSRNEAVGGASSSQGPDAQMEVPDSEMNINEVARLVSIWVNEIEESGEGDEDEENMGIMQEAWDDVNGGTAYERSKKGQGGGDWVYGKQGNMEPGAHRDVLGFDREGANFGKVGRCE